jgi:hypothetical protein
LWGACVCVGSPPQLNLGRQVGAGVGRAHPGRRTAAAFLPVSGVLMPPLGRAHLGPVGAPSPRALWTRLAHLRICVRGRREGVEAGLKQG